MRRTQLLGGALVALAVAVGYDRMSTRTEIIGLTTRLDAADPPNVPVAMAGPSHPVRTLPAAIRDPFHSELRREPARPPVQPSAAPAEPAQPVAPTVPYQYLGAVTMAAGRPAHYLVAEARMVAIEPGTVLDGLWRVDVIEPTHVQLTYLPLDTQHTLSISGQ